MRVICRALILFAATTFLSAECFAADRTALVAFADAFKTGDMATMRGLMTDELRNDLTAERLTQLRQELRSGADEFRDVEVTRGRYFVGSVRLIGFQAKTRHKKRIVRLAEAENDKFSGLDVVLDDQESRVSRPEWCFGSLPARYAAATGEIEVEPVGVDGEPLADATVQLWHAIDADPKHSWAWRDPKSGQWWEPIFHSLASPWKFNRLEAGIYRPVVWEDRGKGYVGIGELATIDEPHADVKLRVAVARGGRLEVRCVDAETGSDVPELYVIAAPMDKPIWEQPQFPFRGQSVDGQRNAFVFTKLPATRLRVTASRLASHPEDVMFESAHTEVEIKPGVTTKLVLKVGQRGMTKEEIDQRWPWEVFGRVTDPDGEPVADAVVRAHCGQGSLFATGAAVTDANGNYRMHFGVSGITFDRAAVYYAQVTASKPGMYEVNLNLHGQLAAAQASAEYGRELYRPDQIIHQDEPRQVDFVLASAGDLAISVQSDKHRDARLDGLSISLKGDVMPPGCSVVDSGRIDRWGSIEFAGVPLDHLWYVEIEEKGHEALRTQPFRLTEPQRYSIVLRWRTDAEGKECLEIASIEDALGRDRTLTLSGVP